MDRAYYNWLILAAIGAALGLFLKPVTILKVGASLFIVAIVGLVVSGVSSNENLPRVFGVAAMAIPIITAITAVGALGMATLKRLFSRGRDQ